MSITQAGRWISLAGLCLGLVGLVLAVGCDTEMMKLLIHSHIDRLFADGSGSAAGILTFRTWIYGVLGATVCSWGLLIAWVGHSVFPEKPQSAWIAMTAALSVWFVVDTAVSCQFGVGFNVAFNTTILLIFAIPLAMTARRIFLRNTTREEL